MTRHMPHSAVKGIIATEGFLDKEQVKEKISRIIGGGRNVRWCYGLFQSLYPYSARKNGVENELKQEWNMDRFPRSDQGAGTHHTR